MNSLNARTAALTLPAGSGGATASGVGYFLSGLSSCKLGVEQPQKTNSSQNRIRRGDFAAHAGRGT